jgi:uracil phosphoribosyltransferase
VARAVLAPDRRGRASFKRRLTVPSVHPSSHPIVMRKLSALRDVRTGPPEFRALVRSLAMLLGGEATADLAVREASVTTPMGRARGFDLTDVVTIVPILRAGLGMAEGLLDLLPDAEVRHIGLFRDEVTLRPTEYYSKLPKEPRTTLALVLDPMLATGGSAVRACEILKASGVARIKLVSLIAAPEGIARMAEAMPDVPIHVGAVDERLTEIGFIYPGLGDAGDRQFATFHAP